MNELELLSFENMGLSAQLLQNIQTLKFKKPTYIQSKLIPLILEGKDVVCCSKTGSGKTAAYMIPLINKLKNHSEVIGSRALILVHSRELALQTARNLRELIHGMDLRYSIIIGGHDYEGQFDSLATNPDIIIATPGRIMEILQETQFSLVKVEYLIIDEADGLFEKGFAPQIKEILKKVSQRRHTILLSATIPEDVSRFASSGLRDYALVKVDSEYKLPDKAVMHNFLCRPEQKVSLLIYTLQNIIAEGERSIIFVSSRQWGDYLDNLLPAFNLTSVNINGKMGQEDRFEKMGMFNRKDAMNLIVTDLGARGLDLPFVRNVINFDFPQSTKLFIHRCGRTARADRTGTIYSFFTPSERLYFGELKSKIERTFETVKQSGVYNYNHIYYGKAPENIIFSGMECISRALKEDTELFNLHVAASNSMEKFEKSRAKVNSAGKKQMDGFDWEAYHPLFEGLVDKSANEFVAKMKQYKPKVSHFGYERAKQQANSDIIKLGSVLQRKCNDHKARAVYKRKMKTDADDENAPMNAEEEYRMHEEEIEADLLIWDDSKKAFKKKKIGLDGEVVNEDHKTISKDKLRVQKMQDRYKTWKKQSPLNFQKVGDRETMSNTNKAVASFKNRMHKKQTSDAIKRKKDVTRRVSESKGNSGFMKGRKVVSELKSASQIAKNKAFKKQKSFGSGRGGRGGSRGGRGGSSRGGSVARGGGKKLGGRH